MSAPADGLAAAIAGIAREAPAVIVDRLIQVLERPTPFTARRWSIESVAAASPYRHLIANLFAHWDAHPDLDVANVALALRAAQQAARSDDGRVDLVWTGPASAVAPARRTDQALLDLIETAQSELVIVSFAVYPGERWTRALREAVTRGVACRFVVEVASSGKISHDGLTQLDPELRGRIAAFTWDSAKRPTDAHGGIGTLHAKCAVADRRRAFVTSANLTEHAQTLNFEIGAIIDGGEIAPRIAAAIDDLIERRILTPIP